MEEGELWQSSLKLVCHTNKLMNLPGGDSCAKLMRCGPSMFQSTVLTKLLSGSERVLSLRKVRMERAAPAESASNTTRRCISRNLMRSVIPR